MPFAAAIVGVVGAAAQADSQRSSANKAADAQREASQRATDTELQMFEQNREDAAPLREARDKALSQLVPGVMPGGDFARDFTLGDFTQDPGYNFRMQQGQQALDRSAAARGGVLGGAALKGAQRYGQNYASGEYQNAYNRFNNDRTQRFNRLSSLAGMGQTAVSQLGNQSMQVANSVGNNIMGAGNAQAAGYIGAGNAQNNMYGNLANIGQDYFAMRQNNQQPWYTNGVATNQRPRVADNVMLSDGTIFPG